MKAKITIISAMIVVLFIASFALADLIDGLVGYWSFDDPGNLVYDYSGTGNHSSLVGGVTSTAGAQIPFLGISQIKSLGNQDFF